ncbi:cold-active zinc metallopeptidase M1 family protein [Neiella marina]|uniref:Aminopeptidase N n=1 Tax=Neiella marina TaxID=508461 RepID=A0A8J2XM57_9GAMM|nr:M1 family metallopeptidase [Neiella marina]GGA75559.1 cold-active zinc metallopeptidase M1 family protein [Neiella marina]
MTKSLFPLVALSLLMACSPQPGNDVSAAQQSALKTTANSSQPIAVVVSTIDPHSYSNFDEVRMNHLTLDLIVDFDQSVLSGTAEVEFERLNSTANRLILDTRDLTIDEVKVENQSVPFSLSAMDPNLGQALVIELPAQATSAVIQYRTSPKASGLQWLTPQQTAGKKQPFLFSQAQAIHARSFIPLQDSPSVRVTYDARIQTSPELLAVMSASNDPQTERDGDYHFSMPQPIPSYLIAIAVGDLQFKAMGPRTGVYAEPSVLDSAVAEFEDTEAMLELTEQRYGAYSWDRYDLLILPPSFPFGGMENPRLSFITPTIIAGDKSLVSLIAHELAHSWSGNTVTNASWSDLWLNEGFTTYLTYRIMELLYGTERYDMEAMLGYQDLQYDMAAMETADTRLSIDLTGRDPDEVFSDVPYEKGALFLREIEQEIGREAFDAFLLQYFNDFAFQSLDASVFEAYIDDKLIKPYQLDRARIEQWIHQPGLPEGHAVPTSPAFDLVDAERQSWLIADRAASELNTNGWVVHQWLYFLNNMPEQLSEAQLFDLDQAFNLTQSSNNEIAHSWLMLVVKNDYQPAYQRLENYLMTIGRNKLVAPLYKALSETEQGKVFAKRVFEQAKAGYHPLTVKINEKFVH